ncbi:MAG: GNAT family N-acetyltransferase [Oscillospiraceae bacterium]
MIYHSEFVEAAAEQLAADCGCYKQDLFGGENIVVPNMPKSGSRLIFEETPFFRMATMGRNAVISADSSVIPFFESLVPKYSGAELFSGKVQYLINSKLAEHNKYIGDVNIYYLPETPYKYRRKSGVNLKIFEENEIKSELYPHKEFSNALMYKDHGERKDKLAVCAMNGDEIIAMAGASSDSERFWQIGIDVKKEFRGLGIGSECVKALTYEIMAHGAIPYYGTWSGNIASQNVARAAGYRPIWTEMYSQNIV